MVRTQPSVGEHLPHEAAIFQLLALAGGLGTLARGLGGEDAAQAGGIRRRERPGQFGGGEARCGGQRQFGRARGRAGGHVHPVGRGAMPARRRRLRYFLGRGGVRNGLAQQRGEQDQSRSEEAGAAFRA